MTGGKIVTFFTGHRISATVMAVLAVMTAVEGTWTIGLPYHWTYVAVLILTVLALGCIVFKNLRAKSYVALVSHFGLLFALVGGLLGMACTTSAYLKVFPDREERVAIDANGYAVPLPFSISLTSFDIDCYEDETSPRQYTSTVSIDGKEFTTSVNHPCSYKGYSIYQSGYDTEYGCYSVLKIVRDPWLPLAAAGAILLAAGAVLGLKTTWKSWKILLAALILGAVFAAISVARINFGTLMPALRSLWFVPHLTIYMLAYAILALAVVSGIASHFTSRLPAGLSGKLLSTASSLLLLGMLCGAVWARQAWGEYWTWDAKECWAAATWLLTMAGTHIGSGRRKLALTFTIVSFLAMQMTWYGVNWLPSSGQSLHTYNQK